VLKDKPFEAQQLLHIPPGLLSNILPSVRTEQSIFLKTNSDYFALLH